MNRKLKIVLDRQAVDNAMMKIANEINKVSNSPLAIVAIMKGGAYTAYEVLKLLDYIYVEKNRDPHYDIALCLNSTHHKIMPDVVIGHIGLESYGDQMKSRDEVKLMTPLDLSRDCIRGRTVIVVDDCVETSTTLDEATKIIAGYEPHQLYTAVLVDKIVLRGSARKPDIVGWEYHGRGFIVGCGMGAGEKYRGLSEICEVVEDEE